MTALKELGFRVPGDLALVGFDDTPLCMLPNPTITSVHQPVEELTHIACDRILTLLGRDEAAEVPADGQAANQDSAELLQEKEQRKLVPCLVERGSTFIEGKA